MELRQLRYFVEIADQGSFTKAAETLAIAQPALTTQIQKLEAEFGAQLFVRTTRGIVLTEVGVVALEQARRTIVAADATKRSAQLASEASGARLIAGFSRIFPFLPIARTVRRIRRERPNIKVELREMWSSEQIEALAAGALDVAFVHDTGAPVDHELVTVPVAEESVTAAIPDGHRLATRRQIALGELADEDFVAPAETTFGETVRDEVFAECRRAGFQPRVVQESSDVRILLGLVSAGLGVALLLSSSRDVKVRGVHYVSIVPRFGFRFAAMYRRGAAGTFLEPFLERIERPLQADATVNKTRNAARRNGA
jgi:DNA-binding transcriptional LysR family regulator